MNRQVALIHTSLVFFERERLLFDILAEILPDVELKNIVDDTMLGEVMVTDTIIPGIIRRMCFYVLAAEAMGVDAVFNTCSSLGPAFDVAKQMVGIPAVKIDDGMAERAARDGDKIAVLATVPTTLKPTVDLIKENAESIGKEISTMEALSEGAFDLLMRGEQERHDEMVVQTAHKAAEWANMLILAQCSMARLAPRLSKETGLPVLSSPRLGIERLKEILY